LGDRQLSQPKPASLRETMPKTAEWVDRMRTQLGATYVNEQIRLSIKGEPGRFYAIEGGNVLGTPFPCTHPIHAEQKLTVLVGASFAGFIAEPEGGTDGTH
jgi:hypothetical protein